MIVQTAELPVRAMTFNILQHSDDGKIEPGGVIAPWSQRRPASAALIKSVDPDVIGIQEANDWIGDQPGTRQIDSLNSALRSIGVTYNIAATEISYPNSGWHRYGDYILYKPSVYRAYAAGGHWDIGDNRWAVYQPLQDIGTGAKFLFVCTHLLAGRGYSYDLTREHETQRLLDQASAKAASLGVPVIYAGDFNTNQLTKQHPLDGPNVVMRAAHINDARLIAQSHHYERYDSMNEYLRTPYAYFIHIDYLFAPPGVTTSSWGTALRLSDGKWVGTIPSDHDPVYATMIVRY
jgi:endonuclease/exonuclease/phosphatase family metal-dependent hydrolase